MTAHEKYQQLLAAHGVSLRSLDLSETGLNRDNALLAISILRESSFVILGGDVYVKEGSNIELAYATWSTGKIAHEPESTYRARCWDHSEKYIRNYPQPVSGEPLFVLVFRPTLGLK